MVAITAASSPRRRSARIVAAVRSGGWLTPGRRTGYAAVTLVLSAIVAVAWIALGDGLVDPAGKPIGSDFLNVYAAGLMVWDGAAPLAYDWPAHKAVQDTVVATDGYYGWHYPPPFLAVAAVLATASYPVALVVYQVATFAGYLLVIRRIAERHAGAILLAAAFPAVFVNLGHGQNGFLTTALLGGALLLLPARPVLAGVLFGLLAYKPQFGLLIPIALVAAGRWPTIASATVTVVAMALAATVGFGPEVNHAFIGSLDLTRSIILEAGATGWPKIQSPFGAVMLAGGPLGLAYAVQTLATVLVAALVAWTWHRPGYDHPTRAAVLVLALPLATPYVLDYDLTVVAVAIAFRAVRGARGGFAPYEATVLAAVWVLPILSRTIGGVTHVGLTPLLLAAALAIVTTAPQARRCAGGT